MSIQNTGATQQPGQGARADDQFDLDFDVDDLLGQLAYDNPVGAGLGGWNESDASMLAAIAAAEVPPASAGAFAPSLEAPAIPMSAAPSNPLAASLAPMPGTQTDLHRRAAAVAIGSSYPVTQAPRAAVAAAPPAVMSSPHSAAAGSGGGASPAATAIRSGRQATAAASQSIVSRKATVVTRKRQRVKKAPGASTSSERRFVGGSHVVSRVHYLGLTTGCASRRAKVGQLMETLEKLVCDQEEPDPSAEGNSTVGLLVNQRPQKKRRPTKAVRVPPHVGLCAATLCAAVRACTYAARCATSPSADQSVFHVCRRCCAQL